MYPFLGSLWRVINNELYIFIMFINLLFNHLHEVFQKYVEEGVALPDLN